ncbi:MAG: DegT/DnrJ/EryC1/StrS family aminotransferase [Pseudomonadota bacterium]
MIKLQKSTFLDEMATKEKLCAFIMRSDQLSMGDECKRFEEVFSAKQGRRYAVFVNSGSSANLILIQALLNLCRLKKGDIVGVSALTWATNIMPIIQLGLVPYLIDCEIDTLNVSPNTLAVALAAEPGIRCIFLTNTLGLSDDIYAIRDICIEREVLLLEDNCEALGSVVAGRLLGNFGLASTFSFFVGHHLSAIEGGMVCTDDEELYEQVVMCRAHGWDRNLTKAAQERLRKKNGVDDFYAKYTFYDLGYNVRATEINGFIGGLQLAYLDHIVEARFDNFIRLNGVINGNNNLTTIRHDHMDIVSSFAIPVIMAEGVDVNKFKVIFSEADVEIRPMIAGNMGMQPFYRKYVKGGAAQPNADYIHRNGFYFGNNPELTDDELVLLADLLTH